MGYMIYEIGLMIELGKLMVFIVNHISMHVLLCIVIGRYSSRLYIAYEPLVSICFSHTIMLKFKLKHLPLSIGKLKCP